ncbi:glycosyltransferase family 4 protein [Sphingomonas sp.]|uniref:glycosyltransferase family 4 protein n=1 Tax=Sphingomonas sp. TaxID=28214 RepID=UPI003BA85EEC
MKSARRQGQDDTASPDGRARRPRIAFLNSHPIQYFAPLYAHINRTGAFEAIPIYLSDVSLRGEFDPGFAQKVAWDIDLLAGTDPIFVRNASRHRPEQALRLLAPDVWSIVRNGNFDALVVHGGVLGANYIAIAAAKSKGIPCFVRGDSHGSLKAAGWKTALRSIAIRAFYHSVDGLLAIGSNNRDYYRSLGIPDERIFHFPFSVDNARVEEGSRLSPGERAAYRQKLGIADDRPIVLFASKFLARKHPDHLLQACARLADEGQRLALVFAGAGEMEASLRSAAADTPQLQTIFTGFLNQTELLPMLGACDIFALPAESEPWGLIINEAMCAGLPIVASREIGAVADLVRDGENGHCFDANDVVGLCDALRPIVADAELRRSMGTRSREIIAQWSFNENVQGLHDIFGTRHAVGD